MGIDMPKASALFVSAFFDELVRWGVHAVIVSPGSRSTPLATVAYELHRRRPDLLELYVDVDERGAAFFALGLAKASGHPACLVCTSGTAVANCYPAVLEAESSRVPLIVLTGDRPLRLQQLGAPQTCDQIKAYGDHVRAFRQMPLPACDERSIAFVRQAAREACIAAGGDGEGRSRATGDQVDGEQRLAGACFGGPVHLNFPFDEPLKPDLDVENLFSVGRGPVEHAAMAGVVRPSARLDGADAASLYSLLATHTTLVVAGEGTCATKSEADEVLCWARACDLPLLSDPLSGLRSFDDPLIIDNYDTVCGSDAFPRPEAVIRFGRYPISKRATTWLDGVCPLHIVVDPLETRDHHAQTTMFIPCAPIDFVRSLHVGALDAPVQEDQEGTGQRQRAFAHAWSAANDRGRMRIASVDGAGAGFEGSFIRRIAELIPEGSCLFAASSMSVRSIDTFYLKHAKRVTVLCNRGLNGIDGVVSSALGAAQCFEQTTLVTGDLALLHDLNALALQRELRIHHGGDQARGIVIVVLNNNGGGIFDLLPQRSDEDYFERLFLTPQDVDFQTAAQAFDIPHRRVDEVGAFEAAYRESLGIPGITLIEICVPLSGLGERYGAYGHL